MLDDAVRTFGRWAEARLAETEEREEREPRPARRGYRTVRVPVWRLPELLWPEETDRPSAETTRPMKQDATDATAPRLALGAYLVGGAAGLTPPS